MKVALVFPPQWTAAQPHAALASLNGQLRRAGCDVSIWDLNLAFVEEALDAHGIRSCTRTLRSARGRLRTEVALRLVAGERSEGVRLAGTRLKEVEAVSDGASEVWVEMADRALRTFHEEERFYDPPRFVAAMQTLDAILRRISAPYRPAALRWNDYANPRVAWDLESIQAFCKNEKENPFRCFYRPWLSRVLRTGPDVIAVSINAFSQVLPGLTWAAMLRERLDVGSRTHVTVGGNHVSRLGPMLRERPAFFHAFAESVVVGEGEGPMLALVRTLEQGGDLREVANLMFLDAGGEVVQTTARPPCAMEVLAFQDFTGFPLSRYLAPERVACVRSSKGCYWGRCAFCDAHYGHAPDSLPVKRLVAELRFLRDRFGIRHFEFVDACIAPAYLDVMCDAFLEAGLDVRWFCNARTEPAFTPGLLAKMARAGATMVMWGIESGSERLLRKMRKGVDPAGRLSVLRAASEAGIWNFAYIFFGFPGEMRREAEETIDLICENTDIIHAYGRSVFTLGRHSPMAREPIRFGLSNLADVGEEFSTNLAYEIEGGEPGYDPIAAGRRCTQRCRRAYGDPLWMLLRSRESLHLYLARHGLPYVRDVRVGAPQTGLPGFTF